MIQIRRGIFETNSSSVHTIAIDERDLDKNKVPKKVTFRLGNYGWGFSNISNLQDYIWTAIVMSVQYAEEYDTTNRPDYMPSSIEEAMQIVGNAFAKYGIETEFLDESRRGLTYIRMRNYSDSKYPERHCDRIKIREMSDYGDIDHFSCVEGLLDKVLKDPDEIVKLVCGEKSFIVTGNDNEDIKEVLPDGAKMINKAKKDKDLWVYVKGN